MNGLGKSLVLILVLGASLLLFVHGQVSLFLVSYSIDSQSKMKVEKAEKYRHLKFEVDQLKAPSILEKKIAEYELDMTLPKEIRVVRLLPSQPIELPPVEDVQLTPFSEGLLNFLGQWVNVAQATTES